MLDAIAGDPVRIRDVIRPLRNPVRFVFLNSFLLFGVILWLGALFVFGVGILPASILPEPISSNAESIRQLVALRVSEDVLNWLPAYQSSPQNWAVISITFLIVVVQIGVMILGLRCFYLPLIAARKRIPLIDAYVESRNAVSRYGYAKHLGLILIVIAIISIPDLFGESVPLLIVSIMIIPLALGLVSSAYRQTIGVEEANRSLREQQFVEMRDELQTAHDMQMDLLPIGPPELDGFFLDGMSVPANNVGGDYFAYRWLDEDEFKLLAIVVADVSGKAMHAAVTALRFNEILRYECRDRTEPGPILDGLTRALDDQIDDATFITCCIAVLHVESGKVEIANAGHCYPYQVGGKSRLVLPIEVNGLPLGIPAAIRPDKLYEPITIDLQPGDGLVIYSDGVVEARNDKDEMYEEDRLCDVIQRTLPTEGVTPSVQAIYRSVETFIQSAPRTDDITVVALQRAISPDESENPQNAN